MPSQAAARTRVGRWLSVFVLFLGALIFLFPFYYMFIGSLQAEPDTSLGGLIPHRGGHPGQLLADQRAGQPRPVARQLRHFHRRSPPRHRRIRASWPAMRWPALKFRGQGSLFAVMLLVQIVPFQLLIIPMYVLTVRHLRARGLLLRHDPAVRDQLHCGLHLPAVLPPASWAFCLRPGSTVPVSCASSGR